MTPELPLTERLFWPSSGSLRIPSAFRRETGCTVKEFPEPTGCEITKGKDEIRLTYVFPRTAFPTLSKD